MKKIPWEKDFDKVFDKMVEDTFVCLTHDKSCCIHRDDIEAMNLEDCNCGIGEYVCRLREKQEALKAKIKKQFELIW